ncbi:hypothetical protein FS842_008995 [Serendipita sp. 407]|nr:hypothetical protein FS842_008995 [Serendipita sp. 407]
MTDTNAPALETSFDRPRIRSSGWWTSFRDLTRRFNNETKADVPPTNGNLPPELLDLVFQFLPRRPPSYGFRRSALQIESWGISRVCKSWYGPATRAIYETIETSTFATTVKLSKTLEKSTHLRSLVRTLLLPTRGKRCPPQVIRVHLQILSLLEPLDEVRVAIPYTSALENDLPAELIKHGETLTALCVHRTRAEYDAGLPNNGSKLSTTSISQSGGTQTRRTRTIDTTLTSSFTPLACRGLHILERRPSFGLMASNLSKPDRIPLLQIDSQ